MNSEAEQQEPAVEPQELVSGGPVSQESVSQVPELQEPDSPATESPASATASPAPAPAAVRTARPLAGVPVWRTGKPDAFLAAAVETARSAIEGITAPSDIGRHLAAKSEGDRLVTHLFESRLHGYAGWQWFAVLTRNSRSKVVTVNELGLLPSGDSILAPEWVPWAERVRPEDEQEPEPEQGPETAEAEPAESDAAAEEDDVAELAAGKPVEGTESLQDQEPGDQEPDDDAQPGDEARTS
jgi:hypothetical protein